MAEPADRVQVIKQESTALGGDDADAVEWGSTPIEPQEDAIEAAGVYFQDASNRDEAALIWRDGDVIKAKDITYGTVELLGASASSGITEAQHKALRQIIHFIDEGPAESFASGAYKETTPTGPFPTSEIWWESSSKLKKIVSLDTTWSGAVITQEVWKIYDTDGSTVLATVTDAVSYSGIFETSRTRTIA